MGGRRAETEEDYGLHVPGSVMACNLKSLVQPYDRAMDELTFPQYLTVLLLFLSRWFLCYLCRSKYCFFLQLRGGRAMVTILTVFPS